MDITSTFWFSVAYARDKHALHAKKLHKALSDFTQETDVYLVKAKIGVIFRIMLVEPLHDFICIKLQYENLEKDYVKFLEILKTFHDEKPFYDFLSKMMSKIKYVDKISEGETLKVWVKRCKSLKNA